MLGQHDARLHDVQIVQHFRIGFGQAGRQEVRLLLIVAFEADTIPGPDHRFEQCGRVIGRHHLTLGEFAARLETFVAELAARFANQPFRSTPIDLKLFDMASP